MASIYVYRRALSSGAKELAEAIGGKRFRGRVRPITEQVKRGDFVVSWGETLAPAAGVHILNGGAVRNKYEDALKLKEAGVATIEAVLRRPAPQAVPVGDGEIKPLWENVVEAAEDFIEVPFQRANPVFQQGLRDFKAALVALEAGLVAPPRQVAPAGEWLARVKDHVGGADLLNPPPAAEYWVKKENIVEEIRVHSFLGKSIRAGIKKPRPGAQQHAWIRSYDGGWSIIYDGFESKKAQRELAHSAVKALGLDFGAVDLGKTAEGRWIVLEVNRAPGLEGGSVTTYATAIKAWMAAPAARG